MTTQQRTALDKANQHRLFQAGLKRSLRTETTDAGKQAVRAIICEPAPELSAMRVEALLRSVHALGQHKVLRFCRCAGVSPTRRVGDLTPHERLRLDLVLR